ncbi:MAG: hypothetical protein J6K58_07535 [Lachnospiraceae bacterium]|nr:hypothetical protein [Lachnospiraceae bacterium]
MKREVLRNISAGMIVIILMLSCFYAGTNVEQKLQTVSNEETEKIAVVNLDEGVLKYDEPTERFYYSNELLRYNSIEFDVVSLESARNGILEGRYAAYIILPADFSEKVESVNYDPEKANLMYAINPYLNSTAKERTIKNLETFNGDINYDISYIYISAILKEFHDVQDSSKVVLSNDLSDEEQLQAVNSEELIKILTYPELRQVEKEIEELNFQELFEANNLLSEKIKEGLKEDLQTGELAYQELQSQSTGVNEASDSLQSTIENYHPGYDSTGALIYQEGIDTLSENFARYNGAQEGKAEEIRQMARNEAYDLGVIAVKAQMEMLQVSVNDCVDSAQQWSSYCDVVENAIKSYFDDKNRTLESKGISGNDLLDYSDVEERLIENGIRKPSEPVRIDLLKISESISSNDIQNLSYNWRLSDSFIKTVDEATSVSMNGVMEIIDDLIIRKLLVQQAETRELIQDENEELLNQIQLYHEAVTEFDPYDYIDDERLDENLKIFKENIDKVETKQGEHDEEYWDLVKEIYEVTEENQEAFDENLKESQEITKENVDNTIALLKESKAETSQENKELLEPFTKKLAYTRLGSLGKVQAYDFIVSPVDFTENHVDQTILEIQSNYQHYILMVIAGLSALVMILFWISLFWKKVKRLEKEEMDNFS